jgi:parvulin-like peptidyl-prolyl isomerase
LHARRRLAEQLVEQARTGVDFGALARQHSDDPSTRQRGGVLGQLRPGQLPAALDTVARGLEVGAVSEPIRQGDEFVILKVVDRQPSALPTFEEARDELGQRVYMEKMEQARNAWLKGLRKRTHVDVRL